MNAFVDVLWALCSTWALLMPVESGVCCTLVVVLLVSLAYSDEGLDWKIRALLVYVPICALGLLPEQAKHGVSYLVILCLEVLFFLFHLCRICHFMYRDWAVEVQEVIQMTPPRSVQEARLHEYTPTAPAWQVNEENLRRRFPMQGHESPQEWSDESDDDEEPDEEDAAAATVRPLFDSSDNELLRTHGLSAKIIRDAKQTRAVRWPSVDTTAPVHRERMLVPVNMFK